MPNAPVSSFDLAQQVERPATIPAWHAYLQLIRPKQWIKNGFVLAPLVFSRQLFNHWALSRGVEALGCWCVLASGIYVANDILDRDTDREHPDKCSRPVASGVVTARAAGVLAGALVILGLLGLAALGPRAFIPGFLYVAINLAYSAYLKRVVIIDVMALASGFVLRVIGGAGAIAVWVSPWLILCTGLLALFLGFEKRRGEQILLNHDAIKHRTVLNHYSPYFLDQLISVLTASAVISYTLYTISEDTRARFGTDKLFLTVPFVLYGIFRYLYLVHLKNGGGNPTEIVFTDRPFAVNLALWIATCALIIYWPK
jgi:4-hydroxybenzoate polyprenyltransferase